MLINKASWHYRLVDEISYPKDNLCQYTRQVIGCILLLLFFFFIACGAATILSYPIWRPWLTNSGMFLGCFVGWNIIGYALLWTYRDEWQKSYRQWLLWHDHPAQLSGLLERKDIFNHDKWYHRDLFAKIRTNKPSPKEPNIFVEYARAIHNKVCPRLEFKNK